MLLATDWTAIGTFVAAAAAVGLALITAWLVLTTRRMVSTAGEQISIERERMEKTTQPHVFPAPTGDWGYDEEDVLWRFTLPVTNGGPGVALNVKAQLRWGSPSGIFGETVPTSLGPGESRDLAIRWADSPREEWRQVSGKLHYKDVSEAVWETDFRIYEESSRHLVEVIGTRMIKRADGSVVG